MAQFFYLQDDSGLNSEHVRILQAPQQVIGGPEQRNVYVYQTASTDGNPGSFQQPQQQPQLQQATSQHDTQTQWLQTSSFQGQPQLIYTSPQQAAQQQRPLNVIVQPTNTMNTVTITMNSQQAQQQQQQQQQMMGPRVVTPAAVRQQMVPVILNTAYRPQQIQQPTPNQTQSVIIQNTSPQQHQQQQQQQNPHQQQQQNAGLSTSPQQTQHVIIDPRTMNVIQTVDGPPMTQQQVATVNRPTVQYRLVQTKPNQTTAVAGGFTRFTRPMGQQQQTRPILMNRNPVQIVRPQFKVIRGAVRQPNPTGMGTVRFIRQPAAATAAQQAQSTITSTATGQPRPRFVAHPTTSALAVAAQNKLTNVVRPMQQPQAFQQNQRIIVPRATMITSAATRALNNTIVARPRPSMMTPQVSAPVIRPMVEVRPPSTSTGNTGIDDFEESISTAILHRAPQPSLIPPSGELQPQRKISTIIPASMHTDVINTQSSCDTAKMLVVLPDEERRLITFTLPTESCTVTELLEQVGIQLTPNMLVRCVALSEDDLDYVVTITEGKQTPPPPLIISTPTPPPSSQPIMQQQPVMSPVRVGILPGSMPQLQQQQQHQFQTPVHNQRKLAMNNSPRMQSPAPSIVAQSPHTPKLIDGFMAICDYCGYFSIDHAKCERCHRLLIAPQRKPINKSTPQNKLQQAGKLSQHVQVRITPLAMAQGTQSLTTMTPGTTIVAVPVKGKRVVKTTTPGVRGGRGATTASAGRGRGARVKKVEEPVVLTLSSDEEEEGGMEQKVAKNVPFPFEPTYPNPEAGDGPHQGGEEISDADRLDVCGEMQAPGAQHAAVECKELRIGSYNVTNPMRYMCVITHLGIKILVPSCADKSEMVKLNILNREIMKVVVHYGKTLPVLFFYTTPSCGRYMRKALGMGNVNQPGSMFYDPANNQEQVKRIVVVARTLRDETRATIKSVFGMQMCDEISHRDALDLLQRSRGVDGVEATGGGAAAAATKSSVRLSLMKNANANQSMTQDGGADASKLDNRSMRSSNKQTDAAGTTVCGDGSQDGQIHKLLIYPQGKGGISINTEDYQCLAVDQYLNDVIIDFYLKYLHQEVMSPEQREKTHIFSSFFYKRLTATSARQRMIERDLKMTPAQKRHNRVKSWTKNVNLFEKEFIVIPINELSHWFLAVICFPGLNEPCSMATGNPVAEVKADKGVSPGKSLLTKQAVKEMARKSTGLMSVTIGNTTITPVGKREENIYVNEETLSERDEAEGDDSDMATEDEDEEEEAVPSSQPERKATQEIFDAIKQPCILVFDSLRGTYRSRVTATLREYLSCEYAARRPEGASVEKVFDKNLMPGHNAKVPQQNNFTDCGLFVLQYVEEMSRTPIPDFKLPMKALKSWFSIQKVTRKREDIALLIKEMLKREHPERLELVPKIDFPTVNGVPVETQATEGGETKLSSSQPQQSVQAEQQQQQQQVVVVKQCSAMSNATVFEEADSEDLFDEIENSVVDEAAAEKEEENNACTPSGKKVTKILFPTKRKSTVDSNDGSSGSEGTSARKTARIL